MRIDLSPAWFKESILHVNHRFVYAMGEGRKEGGTRERRGRSFGCLVSNPFSLLLSYVLALVKVKVNFSVNQSLTDFAGLF